MEEDEEVGWWQWRPITWRESTIAWMITESPGAISTMSAAARAASVAPCTAMPMFACLSAGASLTPSPVIAVTSPADLRMRIRFCLSRGSVREKTMELRWPVSTCCCFASVSAKKSAPVKLRPARDSPCPKMPISRAIASAVGCVSPVIITTRMPAVVHCSIAGRTSGRAGSLMPHRPTNTRSRSIAANLDGSCSRRCAGCDGPSYSASSPTSSPTAIARQRNGRAAILATLARIDLRCAAESATVEPSARRARVQRASTDSGAPFT